MLPFVGGVRADQEPVEACFLRERQEPGTHHVAVRGLPVRLVREQGRPAMGVGIRFEETGAEAFDGVHVRTVTGAQIRQCVQRLSRGSSAVLSPDSTNTGVLPMKLRVTFWTFPWAITRTGK